MSIHTDKAIRKARSMGAYAGNPAYRDLWNLSKRELVEVALRLGERLGNPYHSPAIPVREELDALRANGII